MASNNNKDATIRLSWRVDRQSLNEALKSNDALADKVEASRNRILAIGSAAKGASLDLRSSFDVSAKSATGLAARLADVANSRRVAFTSTQDVDGLRDSLDSAASAAERLNNATSEISVSGTNGGGKGGAIFSAASQVAGNIPGAEGAVQAGGDLIQLGEALTSAGVSVTALTAVALPLGLAIGAVTVAGAIYLDQTKEQSAALASQSRVLRTVIDATKELTTEQATVSIDEIRNKLDSDREELNRLAYGQFQGFYDGQETLFGNFGAAVANAWSSAFDDSTKTTNARIQELVTSIRDGETNLANFTEAIQENAFAANDAAAEQARITSQILSASSQRVEDAASTAQLIASGNSEAIQSTIDLNNVRLEALRQESALIYQFGSTDDIANLNQQINALTAENERLAQSVIPVVQAREAEVRQLEFLAEVEKTRIRGLEQLSGIQQRISDQEAADALTDLRSQEDFAHRRAQQTTDFNNQLDEADSAYQEQRAKRLSDFQAQERETAEERNELVSEFNEDSVKRAAEHQKRLKDIQVDGEKSIANAAAELDGRAVLQAQLALEKQLQDEKENYAEQETSAQEAFNERIALLDKESEERRANFQLQLQEQDRQYQLQRAKRQQDFNQRLQQEDNERAIARRRLEEDRQIRKSAAEAAAADLKASLDKQVNDQKLALQNMAMTGAQFYQTFPNLITQGIEKALTAASAFAGGSSSSSSSSGGGSTPTPSPFGNNVPTPTPYSVNPAAALTAAKSSFAASPSALTAGGVRSGGNTYNVTVNANGLNQQQAEIVVYNTLDKLNKAIR